MNKGKEMKEARKHMGEGQCYIKAEDRELLVCGDMIAIIRVAERIIVRVADISGSSFEETLRAVADMHMLSEEMGGKSEVIEKGKAVPYEATVLKSKIKSLEKHNNRLDDMRADAESIAKRTREKLEKDIAERDRRIKALSQEVEALEHRLAEMESKNMWG